MPRWLFGALGAVALVAVALLLWELRRDAPGTAEPAQAVAPGESVAADSRAASSPPPGAPAPPRRLRHVPSEQEVGRDRMQLLLAEDVPQRILRAAAACYDGRDERGPRMTVSYRLRVEQGAVSLAEVALVESQLGAPALEACVLDAMRALRWRDERAPNMLRKMELSISRLDLKARQPRSAADDAPDE